LQTKVLMVTSATK